MVGRVAIEVHECVVTVVAAKVAGARLIAPKLQPQNLTSKASSLDAITCAQPHVTDIQKVNHSQFNGGGYDLQFTRTADISEMQ